MLPNVSSLKDTIVPKSDQLNAEQLLSAPMAITVTEVTRGSGEQPVSVHYAGEDGRPFKPCKTMRKVLIFAWGDDGRKWVGKSMVLFNDPEVKFGGVKVGGIRISHMSDIERDLGLSLNTTKGKKGEFVIKKLPPIRAVEELRRCLSESAAGGVKSLRGMWGKLNEFERLLFEKGVCPEDIKRAAADADAGVPKNIGQEPPPIVASNDQIAMIRANAEDLGITEAEICKRFALVSLDSLPACMIESVQAFVADPIGA